MIRRTVGVGPNLNQKSVSTSAMESSATSVTGRSRAGGDQVVDVPGVQAVGTGPEVVLLPHSAILSHPAPILAAGSADRYSSDSSLAAISR